MPSTFPMNILIVALVLLPNVLFMVFPPVNLPEDRDKPAWWAIVDILEGIGRIGIFLLPLFWQVKIDSVGKLITLGIMLISISVYYLAWWRYFSQGREFTLLYEPLFHVPLPLAISPVIYFLSAGALINSWPLVTASLIFAAGHIPESMRNSGTHF